MGEKLTKHGKRFEEARSSPTVSELITQEARQVERDATTQAISEWFARRLKNQFSNIKHVKCFYEMCSFRVQVEVQHGEVRYGASRSMSEREVELASSGDVTAWSRWLDHQVRIVALQMIRAFHQAGIREDVYRYRGSEYNTGLRAAASSGTHTSGMTMDLRAQVDTMQKAFKDFSDSFLKVTEPSQEEQDEAIESIKRSMGQ